jgi:DNA-nicking Smr family endonuclease
LPIDGVLDLHAFKPADVAELVQDYLDECARRGITAIRIIHGKGKGTLQRTVHAVLERRTDVLEHKLAPPERGGWGARDVTRRDANDLTSWAACGGMPFAVSEVRLPREVNLR